MMYDIIIPGYNHRTIGSCIDSILENSQEGYRVILIDNNKIPIVFDRRIQKVEMPWNTGWTGGTNAGLAISTAPYVVLMNDDCEVMTDGWLEKLRARLDEAPHMAAVGPRTNYSSYQGRLPEGAPFESFYVPYNPFGPDKKMSHYKLSFFCVMIRREALGEVGFFDPRMTGYGGQEEDWMSRAALKRAWKFGIEPAVLVNHVGSASYGPTKAEQQKINMEVLKQKWLF